jgi:predicted RNA binding protein YcfA (HicA-like mRNA interferase family)
MTGWLILVVMKVRELIQRLEETGYTWDRNQGRGSHRIYVHANKPTVSIPVHAIGRDVPVGLANAILRKAGLR